MATAQAEEYYSWLWPAFERARQPYSLEDFTEEVRSGEVLLVRVWDGAEPRAVAAIRTQQTTEGRELLVMGLVGEEVAHWMSPLTACFEQLAKESASHKITIEGRPGWAKLLTREGFRTSQVVMSKEVEAWAH